MADSAEKKKLTILIVLGVLAVTSLTRGILTPSKARRELSSAPAVIQAGGVPVTVKEIVPPTRRAKRSEYTSWGGDPFAPPRKSVKRTEEFSLNGVLWDEKTPLAIIDGNTVGIGDDMDGYKIVDIAQDSVLLSDGVDEIRLRLRY